MQIPLLRSRWRLGLVDSEMNCWSSTCGPHLGMSEKNFLLSIALLALGPGKILAVIDTSSTLALEGDSERNACCTIRRYRPTSSGEEPPVRFRAVPVQRRTLTTWFGFFDSAPRLIALFGGSRLMTSYIARILCAW